MSWADGSCVRFITRGTVTELNVPAPLLDVLLRCYGFSGCRLTADRSAFSRIHDNAG